MIKKFTDTDFSTIVDIWERSVLATHHFLLPEDFEFYKNTVPSYFPQAECIYVYDVDNSIHGFLGVSGGEIDMLFVDSSYLGTGVGKQLLTYAIDVLNLGRVDVNEQNVNAFEFYKHFGFAVINRSDIDGFGKPYPILHLQRS